MNLKLLLNTPPWDWPPDTGTTLLNLLHNPSAQKPDRLMAAELAGDFTVINDQLAEALLSILRSNDEPEDLRCLSAIALGPILEHADLEGFDQPSNFEIVPINEITFDAIQKTFSKLYRDTSLSKILRRRILEASAHAEQNWHSKAVYTAYMSDDPGWQLTAVYAMRFVSGFEDKIFEALSSEDEAVHFQAVCAAGAWEVAAAWPHIVSLVNSDKTDKHLRLAAIDAIACIGPFEAGMVLSELRDSADEDIVIAIDEAMIMAGILSNDPEDDDELDTAILFDEDETAH